MPGPCTWPTEPSCLPTPEPGTEERERYDAQVANATAMLWALTGRRFGVCEVTVRPCPNGAGCTWENQPWSDSRFGWVIPYLDGGTWRNYPGCGCAGGCQRSTRRALHLPGLVRAISSVVVDGQELVADVDWWFDEGRIIRIGADWPSTQDLDLPATAAGTWSITYRHGTPPPPGAGQAVSVLAKELLAACAGQTCRLPKRVQQITRQGVSATFADTSDLLDKGLTGIPEVDLWIKTWNPNRLQQPSLVASVDVRPDRPSW